MASVYVTFSHPMGPNNSPVRRGAGRSEVITSGATAASGLLTSTTNEIATIFCATAVYASVTGEAAPASAHYVPAGIPLDIAFTQTGQTVSVIDV